MPHHLAPCMRMDLSWFLVVVQPLLARLGSFCLLSVPVGVLDIRRSACACFGLLNGVGVFYVFDVLGGFWKGSFAISESDCIYRCFVRWEGVDGFRSGR